MIPCAFCRRIELRDYEQSGRGTVQFAPLNPVTPGHMLFVPVLHVSDAADKPWVTGLVMEAASTYAQEQRKEFNLITSAGKAATQSVYHLHVHYVPRMREDGFHLPWTKRDD